MHVNTSSGQLTQALKETAEFIGSFGDVQTKLDGKERQGLWTHRCHNYLVLLHVALLMGKEKQWG